LSSRGVRGVDVALAKPIAPSELYSPISQPLPSPGFIELKLTSCRAVFLKNSPPEPASLIFCFYVAWDFLFWTLLGNPRRVLDAAAPWLLHLPYSFRIPSPPPSSNTSLAPAFSQVASSNAAVFDFSRQPLPFFRPVLLTSLVFRLSFMVGPKPLFNVSFISLLGSVAAGVPVVDIGFHRLGLQRPYLFFLKVFSSLHL